MDILPVKFRMLQFVFQNEGVSNDHLYCALKQEYPNDKYVSQAGIDESLLSLKAGGLIEATRANVSDLGMLVQSYKITSYGIGKMKYIK